jgi:hypothetical protein
MECGHQFFLKKDRGAKQACCYAINNGYDQPNQQGKKEGIFAWTF